MAQKKPKLRLTTGEKARLDEAYSLMEYGSRTQDAAMMEVGEIIYTRIAKDDRKVDALSEWESNWKYDENFDPENHNIQSKFLRDHFYHTTGAGGGEITFIRRHKDQKADEVVNMSAVRDTLTRKFGVNVSFVVLALCDTIIPSTVSREYHPSGRKFIYSDNAAYANTWVPPRIKPSDNQPTERPELWQQYLDRLMPRKHLCWWTDGDDKRRYVPQQDYFEAWLVQRIRYPSEQNNVSIVLRGNFGTGKGFWLDTIAKELVGMANYQPVTTKAWKGDFNGDMFDSVIIHLEETNDTRANTADMLKMLVTQDRHRANVKNLPQKFVHKHFAIAISSNYYDPIKIDEHDRRYFVPAWSDHLTGSEGKNETAAFFDEMAWWLNSLQGFQELRDWFEQVEPHDYNFRVAPDSEAKDEISSKAEPSESRKTQLYFDLVENRNKKVAYLSSELQKANYPMTDNEVQVSLRNAGYISVQRKYGGIKHNLWLPKEHKDTHRLDQNGWTLWKRDNSDGISIPKEDGEHEFTMYEAEIEIKAKMDAGKTVVINEYRHPNLKELSLQNGTLVNIMRPTSGGTIYGNESESNDKSDEERDRVCNEFETRQLPYFTDEEIRHLKGKVLMCHCKPKRCHGDSLAKAANDLDT